MYVTPTPPHSDLSHDKRQSNIELLRIVSMMMIILHHSFFHSGIIEQMGQNPGLVNSYLISFLAIGGKIGVNIFFIITGYFSVLGQVKIEKVIKLIFEVAFYAVVSSIIYSFIRPEFSWLDMAKTIYHTFSELKGSFIGTWIMVYILSSYVNIVCTNLSKKRYLWLFVILGSYFSLLSIFGSTYMYSYFSWGVAMYLVGAYIRLYPVTVRGLWLWLSIAIGALWLSSVYYITTVHADYCKWLTTYNYANMLPFVLTSVPMFIIFTRLNIKYNAVINTLGAGALAVYIFHDVIHGSRLFIWHEMFDTAQVFMMNLGIVYICLYCLFLYLAVAAFDIVRRRFVEPPLTKFLNHYKIFKARY